MNGDKPACDPDGLAIGTSAFPRIPTAEERTRIMNGETVELLPSPGVGRAWVRRDEWTFVVIGVDLSGKRNHEATKGDRNAKRSG